MRLLEARRSHMALSLGDALLKVGIDASQFNKDMEETDKRIKSMTEKWQTGLKVVGSAFTALGAAGLKFVNDAKDLNAQLGMTAQNLGISTAEMRKLALETANAGLPIDQVQKSFDLLARAGVSSTTEMRAATEVFDALGDVAGLSADAVANLMIPAYKAFGQELPQESKEVDKFTWLIRNSMVDITDFGTIMARLAPDMNKLGLSMEDAAIYIKALSDKGYQGRKATQMFSSAINDTIKSEEDYKIAVAEAMAAGATEAEATAKCADIKKTFSQVLGVSTDELTKYQTELGNAAGATDTYSAIAESNITLLDKIKEGFKEFGLQAGTFLTPLEPIMGLMTALGPAMMLLSSAQGTAAIKTAGHTVAMIAQKTAALAITIATKAWAAAQWLINAAMTANPIGLIILAVAALIGIIILLVKNWDKVVEGFKAVGQFFTNVWNNVVEFFKGVWNNIVKIFKENWDKILLFLFPVGGIIALIVKNWEPIKEFFSKLWDSVVAIFKTAAEAVGKFFIDAWEGIKNGFKSAVNFLIGLAEGFVNFWIKGLNFLISALNKIKFDIPNWVPLIGGKTFGINISAIPEIKLPRLAQGGIITGPTIAMLGEMNKPEVVMPLDRLQQQPIVNQVIVYVGPEKLADIVDRTLSRRKRLQLV
jgi:TP901 family phage tail tape measure protein